MSLANISIVGNLVKQPEQMHFVSGKVKTTFTVAVNGFGRPARGGDTADFYRVETWGKLADLAAKYLDKGNQIAVSGRLMFDRFVDQQGKNRVIPVVEANQLSLPPRSKTSEGSTAHLEEPGVDTADGAERGVPMAGQVLVEDQIDPIQELFAGSILEEDAESKLVDIDNKVKAKNKRQEKVAIG